MSIERIEVRTTSRTYPILIGSNILENSGSYFKEIGVKSKRFIIVCDEAINHFGYADKVKKSLAESGYKYEIIEQKSGESAKTFSSLEHLLSQLLSLKIERKDVIIALGGGVIGDLVGFASSIVLRGVDFVQIPTTLLAQVDSSVGGKTGINTEHGKNLVGSFYQPIAVFADSSVLKTLSRREILAGYAEILKYALINDYEFFEWLEQNGKKVIDGNDEAIKFAVTKSCKAKAYIVAKDEKESGLRELLNLGHTFGHAFEAECAYDNRIIHGEAVAIGMLMAFKTSVQLGICNENDFLRIAKHYENVGLPKNPKDISISGLEANKLYHHMQGDKKVSDGKIRFILANGIGESFVSNGVEESVIMNVINYFIG